MIDVNQKLFEAILSNNTEIAIQIIDSSKEIDADWRHEKNLTLLHQAAQNRLCAVVERLVAFGSDVNACDQFGNSVLKYAAAEPSLEMPDLIRVLLDAGADPNYANHHGFTPLHCVASHGFLEGSSRVANMLLSVGAQVNVQSSQGGYTPLHQVRGVNMLKLLLSAGADPLIRNHEGQTPQECLLEDEEIEEANAIAKYFLGPGT